jgi:hypothetical protein
MLVWAHSAVFPARPAEVIAAGTDVVSHVCYLGFEHDAVMPARYEDRANVNEALFPPQGDDPVIASIYREMKSRDQILDATGISSSAMMKCTRKIQTFLRYVAQAH